MPRTVKRERYPLKVYVHDATGWLVATSDQLPELFVQGSNFVQIRERAPKIIRRILERKGLSISDVTLSPDDPHAPTHFTASEIVAVAILEDAA